jgi:sec-independent protein translocase protein TatA
MIPGPSELILILIIVVVIFGAKRIPEIMGGLGKGIKTFKKAMDEDEAPPAPPAQEATAAVPPAQAPAATGEPPKEKAEQK